MKWGSWCLLYKTQTYTAPQSITYIGFLGNEAKTTLC